ncbi:MAG: hypothetical protein PHI67_08605 [Candidatus Methanomethylophilaceae archaeon]|nr:hypothetical protein [Candidatus Methanomethylophilaceae archaeon]
MAGAIDIKYNKVRNPQLREFIEKDFHDELFDVNTGHNHDGVNSPTVSVSAVIENNSITSVKIVDGAVIATKIGADAVTTSKILDGAVTTDKLGADAVDGTKIADNAVNSEHVTAGAIDTAHIGDLQVTTEKIAAGAIDGTKLADGAVDSKHIAAGAIDLAHMSANSVDSDQYVNGSIDTVHIGDAQVTNVKLDDLARGSIKVGGADDAVTDLVANTDGYILIGDGTDLGSVAVSGDITITNTGAVTIANNAVENAMLADNSVDSAEIVAGAIDTAHLSAITTPTAKAIADPGTGEAIPVTGNGNVALTLAGVGETNTLAVPTFAGQILTISADTVVESATRIVTVASAINVTGNNTITFDAAGEFISLYGIKLGETFAWKILAYDAGLSTVA